MRSRAFEPAMPHAQPAVPIDSDERPPAARPDAPELALPPPDARWNARQRLTSFAVIAVPCLLALAISFLVTPDDIESGRVILSTPCLTRTLFGVPCPSCGMTRAFAALSHGDFWRAWHYNHLAPVAYVLVWCAGLHASVGALRALARLRRLAARSHG